MMTGLSVPGTPLAADKVIDGGTYTRMSDGDAGDQARYTSDGNLTINGATFNTQTRSRATPKMTASRPAVTAA